MKEEDKVEYWDQKWGLKEQHLREKVILDGSDGEREFDIEILNRVAGKRVLDIGCGSGGFTLRVARVAKSVAGMDTSDVALKMEKRNLAKRGLENVSFRKGDVRTSLYRREVRLGLQPTWACKRE